MTVMWNVELDGSGKPLANKKVLILLLADGNPGYGDGFSVEAVGEVVTDDQGYWEADLIPNSELMPSGTVYKALLKFRGGNYEHSFVAPPSGSTLWVGANLADEPGALPDTTLIQHIQLTTGAHGGLVAANDPRLVDARVPTGPAGGVLAGTWPNPTFAQDMATQLELNNAIAPLATSTSVANEAIARAAADTTLGGRIDQEIADRQGAITGVTTLVTNETNRATAAEAVVAGNLTSESNRATAAEATLTANLNTEVTARTNAVNTLTINLSNEILDRVADDENLVNMIGVEEDARIAGDVDSRARANHTGVQAISTVTGLQSSLDTLATSINEEVTNRTNAVSAVQAFSIQRINHTGFQAISTITNLQSALDANATAAANALNRANHTGVQAISTVSGLQAALDAKASVTTVNGVIADLTTEVTRATDAEATKLAKASNLSDLTNATTARTNLGLGTAATANTAAFDAAGAATAAQAFAIQRANHTGTQAISTVSGLQGVLDAKADLVGGLVPASQLPSIAISDFLGQVSSQAAMLALVGQRGDWAIRDDLVATFILVADNPAVLSSWKQLPTPADLVSSVNGRTGFVTGLAEQADLLAEVTNRTNADTAVQAYAVQRGNHTGSQAISTVTNLQATLDLKETIVGAQAKADAAQSAAIQRVNHTGSQAISTITGLQAALDSKPATASVVLISLIDSKGDLLVGTSADNISRLGVGGNGQILSGDDTTATGLKWITPPGVMSVSAVDSTIVIGGSPSAPTFSIGSVVIRSPDNTRWQVTVGNDGALTTTAI